MKLFDIGKYFCVACMSVMPVFGHSALVNQGTITLDTDTGLKWLDLTESFGWSYDDIALEFGVGGEFEGYRRASYDEIIELLFNAEVDGILTGFTSANYQGIAYLSELIHLPNDQQIINYEGIFADNDFVIGANSVVNGIGGIGTFAIAAYNDLQIGSIGFGSTQDLATGHFLVVEEALATPIPSAIWLFSSAILGVGIMRRLSAYKH